jgi:hypothetical protein
MLVDVELGLDMRLVFPKKNLRPDRQEEFNKRATRVGNAKFSLPWQTLWTDLKGAVSKITHLIVNIHS